MELNIRAVTIATALAFFPTIHVTAKEAPVKLSSMKTSGIVMGIPVVVEAIKLVVTEDNVKINQIVLNRGRCTTNLSSTDEKRIKGTLNFGDSFEIYFDCPNGTLLEVRIETNRGGWTWKW